MSKKVVFLLPRLADGARLDVPATVLPFTGAWKGERLELRPASGSRIVRRSTVPSR